MAKSRFKNENLFTYLWTPEMHSDSRESWVVILWLKSNSFFLSSFFLSSCWVKLGKPPPKLLVLDSASIISESYTSPTLWSSNLCLRNSRMGVKVSAASYGSALGREGPVQLECQAWDQIFCERGNSWRRAESCSLLWLSECIAYCFSFWRLSNQKIGILRGFSPNILENIHKSKVIYNVL